MIVIIVIIIVQENSSKKKKFLLADFVVLAIKLLKQHVGARVRFGSLITDALCRNSPEYVQAHHVLVLLSSSVCSVEFSHSGCEIS